MTRNRFGYRERRWELTPAARRERFWMRAELALYLACALLLFAILYQVPNSFTR